MSLTHALSENRETAAHAWAVRHFGAIRMRWVVLPVVGLLALLIAALPGD